MTTHDDEIGKWQEVYRNQTDALEKKDAEIARLKHYIADTKIAVGLMQEAHKIEIERLQARCATLKAEKDYETNRLAAAFK